MSYNLIYTVLEFHSMDNEIETNIKIKINKHSQ